MTQEEKDVHSRYQKMVEETLMLVNRNRKRLDEEVINLRDKIEYQGKQIDILIDLFAKKP